MECRTMGWVWKKIYRRSAEPGKGSTGEGGDSKVKETINIKLGYVHCRPQCLVTVTVLMKEQDMYILTPWISDKLNDPTQKFPVPLRKWSIPIVYVLGCFSVRDFQFEFMMSLWVWVWIHLRIWAWGGVTGSPALGVWIPLFSFWGMFFLSCVLKLSCENCL